MQETRKHPGTCSEQMRIYHGSLQVQGIITHLKYWNIHIVISFKLKFNDALLPEDKLAASMTPGLQNARFELLLYFLKYTLRFC